MTCNEDEGHPALACPEEVTTYWQCPARGCGLEIAYCGKHGGSERATREMAEHIKRHSIPATNPVLDAG